ncbi:aliphatic sulfonate ABC transporter substrate-binding protein [Roseibium sp. SCP14]|uniref:aliphatic sulfonate ABC transporter substrate-binding protein n=1 Tax=Roseibium sp. SCP14 TaxID=3141375 RepID=UPI0033392E83
MTRRAMVAATAAAMVVSATGSSLAENAKIRMGYIADYFGTSIAAIATENGLWEKHGIDAELKVFTNGPIQVQALGAGSLDFAYLGAGALWLPATGKAKVIAVNALGLSDRVISQSGISSVAELKGKKVGVPEGTSGDMLLRLALDKAGLSIDDIEAVKMDPSTVVAAMASKQIDAAGIWYPFVEIVRKQVPDLVELAGNDEFFPEISFPSVFVVRNEFAGNEDTVMKVNAVIKEALDFRHANPDQAVEITAKFLGVPVDPLAVEAGKGKLLTSAELEQLTKDGFVDAWLANLANMYATFGKIEEPLDPKEYYLGELFNAS